MNQKQIEGYLTTKHKPKNNVECIAWLLLNIFGCKFCKTCRGENCPLKEGESCTENIANYIREIVKGEMNLSGQFEWSDVNKNPPETCGMPVLIVVINQYGQRRVIKGFTNYSCPLEFKTNDKEYANLGTYWKVTHWAPMPELPKIEKEE